MNRNVSPLPKLSLPAPPCVLLTGFDAFGGASINPSWLTAKALDGKMVAGHKVVAAQLPTEFDASPIELARLLTLHKPALVLCLGQAGGRSALSIERIAVNVSDASMADNAGKQPMDEPIVGSGPAAYFSTVPVRAMLETLQREGIAGEISQTAGTYVCNHVFYTLMHALATERDFSVSRGGFIHVPYLEEQGTPYMPLADMVRGLHLVIKAALTSGDAPVQPTAGRAKIS